MTNSEISAQVGDEAVHAKTGKRWDEWFALLDEAGAAGMTHKQIVAHLGEHYQLGGWWQQSVTVTYEKARGLRAAHQRPDGYEVGGSKTVAVPLAELFAAWSDAERRREWLEGDALEIHRSTEGKSLRARWREDDSRVEVNFYAKGPAKSQVAVTHRRLPSAEDAERLKAFWAERLGRLAAALTPAP
jgi:hypothetical protein